MVLFFFFFFFFFCVCVCVCVCVSFPPQTSVDELLQLPKLQNGTVHCHRCNESLSYVCCSIKNHNVRSKYQGNDNDIMLTY